MVVRFGLLKKNKDLKILEFRNYWREIHGPLAANLLKGLRGYVQNHIIKSVRKYHFPAIQNDLDGLSELWFDDLTLSKNCLSAEDLRSLINDEKKVFEDVKFLTATQKVIVPPAHNKSLFKYINLFRRNPSLSKREFEQEWLGKHASLVKQMKGLKGYTQNLIIERVVKRGELATYEELPIDGLAEIWFQDSSELLENLVSPAGKKLIEHEKNLISGMTTFLVEVHKII
jgi:hypothetical protein